MKNKLNNNIFIWILLIIIIILVLFLPKIYNYIETLKLPKVENVEQIKQEENKEINEDILESIHYPLMRNSLYNSNTYYSLDKFTLNDMSNSDILLNAFLDIYEGNITNSESIGACANVSKQFDQNYLELRVKNILSKNLNYTLENFYVPEDLDSNYVGEWVYDSYNSRFVYKGLCQSNLTATKYYNLEELIKVEYEGDDIVAYYYVGFARVENSSYTMYSDAKLENVLSTGNEITYNELMQMFKNIETSKKKIYKYTFKDSLCSYNDYCLYKGEWVNEL